MRSSLSSPRQKMTEVDWVPTELTSAIPLAATQADPIEDGFAITQLVSAGFVAFACLTEGLLFVIICVTNGVLLAAFLKSESLRTISNYYIIQMAIADFSVGLWMPMHIAMFLLPAQLLSIMPVCTFRYASLLFSMGGSITSLLAMTYDRLSAILHPLHYQAKMTTARYIVSAVIVWIFPFTFATICMLYHNNWDDMPFHDCELILVIKVEVHRFILLPFVMGSSLVMIIMYAIILRVAYRQAQAEPPQVDEGGRARPSRLQKEMKMIRTGLIVFAAFYLCWLPMILLVTFQVSYTPVLITPLVTALRSAATFPAILNSALNPIVYAFRMPLFRQHFYKLIPCKRNKINAIDERNTTSSPVH